MVWTDRSTVGDCIIDGCRYGLEQRDLADSAMSELCLLFQEIVEYFKFKTHEFLFNVPESRQDTPDFDCLGDVV